MLRIPLIKLGSKFYNIEMEKYNASEVCTGIKTETA